MPVTSLLAAVGAGAAAWLVASSPSVGVDRALARRGGAGSDRLRGAVLAAVAVGALAVLAEGATLALGLLGVAAFVAGLRTVQRGRRRRTAQQRADRVVEVCEALAGELRSGQPPVRALRHAAEVWPELAAAARAGELGGDVPCALRRVAGLPGAAALTAVAAAWQVSEGSGGTMALALGRVVESSRRRRRTQRLVASELASAQATARLVAALPLLVLTMGSGLGGDPWAFLLTTPPGLGCLGGGLVLAYAGLVWIERIASSGVDP